MAIAGVPATAWEMARVLEHSFQYFRRTQLQEMSVDGKVRALSKLLRDNFGFVMQGVGVVVPIFATYELGPDPAPRLYFYDAMGAQFEVAEYAASGSGSPAVRGILYHENNWGGKPLLKLREKEAVTVALRALDTAAEADTATGGVDRSGKIFPIIKIISRDGIMPPCRIKRLPLSSSGLWHDRRAVSVGGSGCEPARICRNSARSGKSDRSGELSRRNSFRYDGANEAEAVRDLRSDCDGGDWSSWRYRTPAHGGD